MGYADYRGGKLIDLPLFLWENARMQDVAIIILAAGEGTRMRSNRAKVLHEIAGIPMIRYVVETALSVVNDVVVVIGHQAEGVRKALEPYPVLRFSEANLTVWIVTISG